jgi:hypothetical protein
MSWYRIWSKPRMLSSMESTGTSRDRYKEDAVFGLEMYYGQSGTRAMRLKLLFLVISVCNFASFICIVLTLKGQNKRCRFPAMYIYKKTKRSGLSRVCPGRPGFRSTRRVERVSGQPVESTGFRRANSSTGFYLDPDRSQTRVLGRPTGPVQVSKLWCKANIFFTLIFVWIP